MANLRARSVRTLRDPALTWGGNRREPRHNETGFGQLRRLWQNFVQGQFGPCATRLPPGAGRRGCARVRTDLAIRMVLITTFSKGAIPLPFERSFRTILTFVSTQRASSGCPHIFFHAHVSYLGTDLGLYYKSKKSQLEARTSYNYNYELNPRFKKTTRSQHMREMKI